MQTNDTASLSKIAHLHQKTCHQGHEERGDGSCHNRDNKSVPEQRVRSSLSGAQEFRSRLSPLHRKPPQDRLDEGRREQGQASYV